MAIIESTDSETLQEIRYELHIELTVEELPDAVLNSRTVLRAANRETLKGLGLTAAQYAALDTSDERRDIAEEVVIKTCAAELMDRVAQIIMDNQNGLLTRYQSINWNTRQRQKQIQIMSLLSPYKPSIADKYFSVASATNEEC